MTMLKKLFFITLLLLGAASLSAQSALETDKQALYNAELRNKLNIDYSMPEYKKSQTRLATGWGGAMIQK